MLVQFSLLCKWLGRNRKTKLSKAIGWWLLTLFFQEKKKKGKNTMWDYSCCLSCNTCPSIPTVTDTQVLYGDTACKSLTNRLPGTRMQQLEKWLCIRVGIGGHTA